MPFCNQCGADVTGVKFCPKCGAPAVDEPATGAGAASGPTTTGGGATPTGGPAPHAARAAPASSDISENVAAALAYITPVAIILLLIEPYKNNRFVRFHSFQSIFYTVAAIAIGIGMGIVGGVLSVVGIGFVIALLYPLFNLAVFVIWILLVVKAYQKEMYKLPVIGDFSEKQL